MADGYVQPQFSNIIEPYGPITLEDLMDPDREDQILELLYSTLAFAAAQLAKLEQ